jgi:energy-coupling factor transport system substrate-specific component
MTTTARRQPAARPWSVTTRTLVYGAIGAGIMGFMNSLTYDIGIPGTEIAVRPHYGILTFFGFAFGPVVGFMTGFFGGLIGDFLSDFMTGTVSVGSALETAVGYWHWSMANGLVGLVAGVVSFVMASRMTSTGRRALISAATGVLAVAIGFLFIFVELVIQPQLGFEYILRVEYIPTVIANSIAAAIVTPILVLAWDPIADQLER